MYLIVIGLAIRGKPVSESFEAALSSSNGYDHSHYYGTIHPATRKFDLGRLPHQINNRFHGNEYFTPICRPVGASLNVPVFLGIVVIDFVLLILLFVGLRRWSEARSYSLWNVLRNQVSAFPPFRFCSRSF